MEMKNKFVLLSVNPYKFTTNEGEVLEGSSLHFIQNDTLKPFADKDGNKGYKPFKITLPKVLEENINSVPGVYDVGITLIQTNDGLKPKLNTLQFVNEIKA